MGLVDDAREEFRNAALKIPEVAELHLYTQDLGQLSTLELIQDSVYDRGELDILSSLPLMLRLWRRSKAIQSLERLLLESRTAAFADSKTITNSPLTNHLNAEIRALIHWLCMRRAKMSWRARPSSNVTTGSVGRHWLSRMKNIDNTDMEPDYDLAQTNLPTDVIKTDEEAADSVFKDCVDCVLAGAIDQTHLEKTLENAKEFWPLAIIEAATVMNTQVSPTDSVFDDIINSVLEPTSRTGDNLIPYDQICLVMENLGICQSKIDQVHLLRQILHRSDDSYTLLPHERQLYGILSGDFAAATELVKSSDWESLLLIALISVVRDQQCGLVQSRLNPSQRELSQIVMDQPLTKLNFGALITALMSALTRNSEAKHHALLETLSALFNNMQGGPEFAYCEFVETLLKNHDGFSHPLIACAALEGALIWRELEVEAREEHMSKNIREGTGMIIDGESPFDWVHSTRVCNVSNAALRCYVDLCVAHRHSTNSECWASRTVRLISCADLQLQRKLIAEVLASEIHVRGVESSQTPFGVRNVMYEAAAECPRSALASWALVKDGLVSRVQELCAELLLAEDKAVEGIQYESDVLVHESVVCLQREIALFIRVSVSLCLEHILSEEESALLSIPNLSAECSGELFTRSFLSEITTSALLSLITLNYFYYMRITDTAPASAFDPSSAIWGVSTRDANSIFWQGRRENMVCCIKRSSLAATELPDLVGISLDLFTNLISETIDKILAIDETRTTVVPHSRCANLELYSIQDVKADLKRTRDWTVEHPEYLFRSLETLDGLIVDKHFVSLVGIRNWSYAQVFSDLIRRITKIGWTLCSQQWDLGEFQTDALSLKNHIEKNVSELKCFRTNRSSRDYLIEAITMELRRVVRGFARLVPPEHAEVVSLTVDELEEAFLNLRQK